MVNIKLIAFDLDGTIVGKSGKIKPFTHEVFEKLYQKGIKLCAITGRNFEDTYALFEECNYSIYCIPLNGSSIFDENKILMVNKPIPNSLVDRIIDFALSQSIITGFYGKDSIVSINEGHLLFGDWLRSEYLRFGMSTEFLDRYHYKINHSSDLTSPVLKCEMFVENHLKTEQYANTLKEYDGIEVSISGFNCIEVTAKHVNKGNTLKELMIHLGIEDDEVIVCGDSGNDLSMIERFKYSLVPANGKDFLKNKAYYVCDRCEDEGIAAYLSSLINKAII